MMALGFVRGIDDSLFSFMVLHEFSDAAVGVAAIDLKVIQACPVNWARQIAHVWLHLLTTITAGDCLGNLFGNTHYQGAVRTIGVQTPKALPYSQSPGVIAPVLSGVSSALHPNHSLTHELTLGDDGRC